MKRNIRSLLLAISCAALATTAVAQNSSSEMGKGHKMPMFSDIDADGDGAIVAAEFYQFRGERMADHAAAGGKMKNAAKAPTFEDIDSNGDGEVSPEEFSAHKAEHKSMQRKAKADDSKPVSD